MTKKKKNPGVTIDSLFEQTDTLAGYAEIDGRC